MSELEMALQKLAATKAHVAKMRQAEKDAVVRRKQGVKLVRAKMRELRVTLEDLRS